MSEKEKISTFSGFEFQYSNSFEPNLTSLLLRNAVTIHNIEGKAILDLGCGCGAVGLSLMGKNPSSIVLSDISSGAMEDCQVNIQNMSLTENNPNIVAIKSNGFESLNNNVYDLIIDDISGISEDVAKISPWFENAPCDSGKDGLKLFRSVITNAKDYLAEGGVLFAPLISLSNIHLAHQFLKETLTDYQTIIRKEWFLPDIMGINHKEILANLIESGDITLDYKYGKFIAWTEVIVLSREAYR